MTEIANSAIFIAMSSEHLEPAKSIISKLGVEAVAGITGKHVSRVYRWMYSKKRGGTGGQIPIADAALLLAYAREEGVELSAEEFFMFEPAEAAE